VFALPQPSIVKLHSRLPLFVPLSSRERKIVFLVREILALEIEFTADRDDPKQ
jgi:hypothetical protein